jgi:hypothetical protein
VWEFTHHPQANYENYWSSTVKSIQKREQDSIMAAEKGIAALNFQVNPKIQSLFDGFNKT